MHSKAAGALLSNGDPVARADRVAVDLHRLKEPEDDPLLPFAQHVQCKATCRLGNHIETRIGLYLYGDKRRIKRSLRYPIDSPGAVLSGYDLKAIGDHLQR